MLHEILPFSVDYAAHGARTPKVPCELWSYALPAYGDVTDIQRPAVIILPGGAYRWLSDREGEPVASAFLAAGISAFILRYTVADDGYFPCALIETFEAVKYVRAHASEWHIDPHRIWLCGFSAGGHAAGAAGTLWNHPFAQSIGYTGREHRADGMILSYPVISSGTFAHRDSIRNLLGPRSEDASFLALVSLEQQVNDDTPPAFLWHTAKDGTVPVQNSLLYATALVEHGVECEMHIYPRGDHGLSTARFDVLEPRWYHPDPYILQSVPTWTRDAIRFIGADR